MAVMINDPKTAKVWLDIEQEIQRSINLHPALPKDPLRRTAIMCEESGEALRAALNLTRDYAYNITDLHPDDISRMVEIDRHIMITALWEETVHTAASAIRNLVAMLEDAVVKRERLTS